MKNIQFVWKKRLVKFIFNGKEILLKKEKELENEKLKKKFE
jgi:hypothetical protein